MFLKYGILGYFVLLQLHFFLHAESTCEPKTDKPQTEPTLALALALPASSSSSCCCSSKTLLCPSTILLQLYPTVSSRCMCCKRSEWSKTTSPGNCAPVSFASFPVLLASSQKPCHLPTMAAFPSSALPTTINLAPGKFFFQNLVSKLRLVLVKTWPWPLLPTLPEAHMSPILRRCGSPLSAIHLLSLSTLLAHKTMQWKTNFCNWSWRTVARSKWKGNKVLKV